jgi:transcriptional regulator with XRE-family HTH domain
MEFLPFGDSLKNIRIRAGFSQKDLAAGICSQAQISKIEKNEEIPSAILLKKISEKLSVDMNYFFDIQEAHKKDYIKKVKEEVRILKKEVKYRELQGLLRKVEKNPLFHEGENFRFLRWHIAICMFYLDNETIEAIELLNETLQTVDFKHEPFLKEMDLEIINSLAIFQKELCNYGDAEDNFLKAFDLLKQFPQLSDPTIELRLLFGLAQGYTETRRFQESMSLCQKGIKICNQIEMLNFLGHFHYQVGENLAKLGEKTEAKKAFNKACLIFQLQDNHNYLQSVKENEAALLEQD